jgi:DNA invertase Pin-like site-specific DNA recombinase
MSAPLRANNNNLLSPLNGNLNDTESMYTAIYLRVSTGHQTLEQQLLAMQGFLSYQGIDVDSKDTMLFEENDKSATKYKSLRSRPAGRRMFELIDAGLIDKLVVVDYDRIWRDGITGVNEAIEIQSKGTAIICTLGGMPVDLSTSDGFMMFWTKMGQAQVECMRTSERVSRKQDFNLETRKTITGRVYGWVNTSDPSHPHHGELHPDYEEQAVINWILESVSGRNPRSWSGTASILNRKGVPTATGVGKWQSSSVKRVTQSKTQQALGESVRTRYFKHPILGKVRCDYKLKIAVPAA